jgi:hypothetical protein
MLVAAHEVLMESALLALDARGAAADAGAASGDSASGGDTVSVLFLPLHCTRILLTV